jgi:DNA repair exonuclease SbcCD ATPase subunit
MGSGKTSVLDSICFAFFGTFPNLQSRKLKLDDIIMKKPVEKDKAEVEVSFRSNNKIYSVKRIVERGKGTTYSELREDGKLLEAPNAQRVSELVERLLKVNYELFSKAIYSEQNALDYFLTIPKGQRMKRIDELLMIDKFEKARANAVTLTNKIAERKLAKQNVVEQTNVDTLQKNINDLKHTLNVSLAEKRSLQENLEKVTIEKVKLEKEVSELRKIRENLEILKREERGIASAIQETATMLEKFEKSVRGFDISSVEKNLNNLSRLIKDLEQLLKEKQKQYQKLQEQASKSKAEVELLRKEKIEKLEKELNEKLRIKAEFDGFKKTIGEDVEKQINEKKALVEKLVGEIEATRMKIKDLQDVIEQLSSLEGKCPICESKLTEARKKVLIKQKQLQIKALKESLEKASEKKQLSELEIKQLEDAIDKLDEMSRELEDFDEIKTELENSRNVFIVLKESATKFEEELSALANELENLQNKYNEASNEKQKFELLYYQLKEYEDKRNRIGMLMKEREGIVKHIEEMEKSMLGKDLEKQETWLRNLVVKEKEIVTRILGLKQLIEEREVRVKDLENVLTTVLKEKEEIKRLDKLIQELKIFEKSLGQTQVELRTEFVEAVNYAMNKLWSTLYPYQDFTGIRLNIEEGDYVLQLQERSGKYVNVEGVASGGERSIACLALRIAFALVLAPQLRIAFLDEPSHNLDSNALVELAITLRERIGEFLDQVLLITHQEELIDAVTGKSYRLERDKTVDGVTKITPVE